LHTGLLTIVQISRFLPLCAALEAAVVRNRENYDAEDEDSQQHEAHEEVQAIGGPHAQRIVAVLLDKPVDKESIQAVQSRIYGPLE
jgi:hypothetical protein